VELAGVLETIVHWCVRGTRSFYFEDPAGNLLEIAERDMWPP
jgi:catechol 2,3-dioxygenase-like lactoylglutathione lyase family enzyme